MSASSQRLLALRMPSAFCGQLLQLAMLSSSWCVIVGRSFLCGLEKNISLQFRTIIILSFCTFPAQTKFFFAAVNAGQHAGQC